MDQFKILLQKLTDAADAGEDNSVLLAIVEELSAVLKQPAVPENISSSIAVMLPNGFRPSPSTAPTVPSSRPAMSVPRPPARVIEVVEETPPVLIEKAGEQPVIAAVIHEENPIVQTLLDAAVSIECSDVVDEEKKRSEPASLSMVQDHGAVPGDDHLPIAEAEEKIELPKVHVLESETESVSDSNTPLADLEAIALELTPEMIEEAVTLERLALYPEEEPEWQVKPAIEETTPTTPPRDLNEKMAHRSKMLNEVFTQPTPELASILVESRIQDLRKAISINEKYQYINSLFRGDEAMFERSVKTLNNFSIMPEAEYWMQRELLIKLGWNDEDELVQRFFSLVKRRFA